MEIDKDAFSSGQITSKLWLCEELESTGWNSLETWIYGGWYGLTAFLLLSRGTFIVDKIRSYDIDLSCEPIADMINENWVWQDWKFKAFSEDCNQTIPLACDLIINTATEHFDNMAWWNNIPVGKRIVLQGNNMRHEQHVDVTNTLEDFYKKFPLGEVVFQGEKEFVYPDWSFKRFMLIGKK
jgi:hypothetical protein